MRLRHPFSWFYLLPPVAAALFSVIVWASDEISLSWPEIVRGTVIEGGYFTGEIEVASTYTGAVSFTPRHAAYSLDGGINYQDVGNAETIVTDRAYTVAGSHPLSVAPIPGGYIVAWAEPVEGTAYSRIAAQRYDRTGGLVGSKLLVTEASYYDTMPAVAALSSGVFAIVWQRQQSHYSKIVMLRFSPDGTPLHQPVVISSDETYQDRGMNFNCQGDECLYWRAVSPSIASRSDTFFTAWRLMHESIGGAGTEYSDSTYWYDNEQKAEIVRFGGSGSVQDRTQSTRAFFSLHEPNLDIDFGGLFASVRHDADATQEQAVSAWLGHDLGVYVCVPYVSCEQPLQVASPMASVDSALHAQPSPVLAMSVVAKIVEDNEFVVAWTNGTTVYAKVYRFFAGSGQYLPVQTTQTLDNAAAITGLFALRQEEGEVLLTWTRRGSDGEVQTRVNSLTYGGKFGQTQIVDAHAQVGTFLNEGSIVLVSQDRTWIYPQTKTVSTGPITPNGDIYVKFRLLECEATPCTAANATQQWTSETAPFLHADPNAGKDGTIAYADGYTQEASVLITVDPNCGDTNCLIRLEAQERRAPLSDGDCGWSPTSEWSAFGSTTSTETTRQPGIDDGTCYQFRALATNYAGTQYTYTSANTVKADRTPPAISVTGEQRDWDLLTLALDITDSASGVTTHRFALNTGPETAFTGSSASMAIVDGQNRIEISAEDGASNRGEYTHFVLADLTPPDILIHTVEEGQTYGDDLTLVYSLTQELQNLTITVDGVPRSDLSGLDDGAHTLVIEGTDARGNLIQKTVHFTVDHTLFSFTLLSPQARLYQTRDVEIQYQASEPPTRVWYSLNGGPQSEELLLSNLADGAYSLTVYAESPDGTTASRTVAFTVEEAIPVLDVVAPVEGGIYTQEALQLSFFSNGTVSYEVGTQSGTAQTGEVLTLADGSHTLKLTAVHPVSGNVVTEAIHFTVDTLAPELTLTSPAARLYTFDAVPVQYTANKALSNVVLSLDGAVVDALEGLTPGHHTFAIRGEDAAGREVSRQVQFEVATIEMVTPADGAEVISNSVPPLLPFEYTAQGNFTSYTVAFDGGPQRLLNNPPGTVTDYSMRPGQHEAMLSGHLNEFVAVRYSQFTLGAKNIAAGPGSIDYRYANCDESGCDVTVTLRLENTGDYPTGAFSVRFDHVSADGYESQTELVAGVGIGVTAELPLQPLRAALGDTFALTIDPYSEMEGEWREDNNYQLQFETGQISNVSASVASSSAYIAGVSVFNDLDVTTAGPIATVELRGNGWVFVDNTPQDGFNLVADMGLLSPENNCYQVLAMSASRVALDTASFCSPIKNLSVQDAAGKRFPWERFASAEKYVVQSDILAADFDLEHLSSDVESLSEPIALVGETQGGAVTYKLMVDPGQIAAQPYTRWAELGDAPLVGSVDLHNGHALYTYTIHPEDDTCGNDGVVLLNSHPLNSVFKEPFAEILADLEAQVPTNAMLEAFADERRLGGGFESPLLSAYGNYVHFDPDGVIQSSTTYDTAEGFVGDAVCALHNDSGDLHFGAMEQRYRWELVDARLNLSTKEVEVEMGEFRVNGITLPIFSLYSYTFPVIGEQNLYPLSLDVGLFVTELEVLPLNINVPIEEMAEAGLSLFGDRFYPGPAQSHHRVSYDHQGRLANGEWYLADIDLNVLWGLITIENLQELFGFSYELKADLTLRGIGKADWISGYPAPDFLSVEQEDYGFSDYYSQTVIKRRRKVCLLGICDYGSWHTYDTIVDGPTVVGTDYDMSAVDDKYATYGFYQPVP